MKKILAIGGVFVFVLSAVSYSVPKVFADTNLTLTVPSAATITQSASLVTETNGTASDELVSAAIDGVIPIMVTLGNTGDDASDESVRINAIGADSHVQLWAKDATGWYDINVTGWGPSAGFSVPAPYNAVTNVYPISDAVGTYALNIKLVDATSGETVKNGTGTLTVNAPAPATVASVANLSDLQGALANPTITTINLMADVSTTVKLVASNPVTINGNNHTISFSEITPTTWGGYYVLQVYKTTATLNDIKLTGGNAALLVNGSAVTLTGNIDVSGNGFGGIEVSKGAQTGTSTLDISNAILKDISEAYSLPTIWTITGQGAVIGAGNGFTTNTTVNSDQTQYYLRPSNAVKNLAVINQADLISALASSTVGVINIGNDFIVDAKIIVNRPVTIDGGNKIITFANTTTPTSTVWHGNYLFEVYATTGVTIKNIKLTGGNAALYVNGSAVTLEGNVNVSGNGFGGIEVSKGNSLAGSTSTAILTVASGATLFDSTEAYGLPTVWMINGQESVINGGAFTTSTAVVTGQTQYYLAAGNAVVGGGAPVVIPIEPAPVIEYGTAGSGGGGGGNGGGGYYNPYVVATMTGGQVLGASTSTVPQGQVLGASAFNFTTNLSLGSESSDVTELQNRLTQEGVYSGPITGYLGSLTQAAVKAYQSKYGISGTGYVGSLTRTQLNSVNNTQVSGASATGTVALQTQIGLLQAQLLVLLQQLAASLQSQGTH